MKNIKKFIAILSVLAMLFAVGCSAQQAPEAAETDTSTSSEVSAPAEEADQTFTYVCGTEPSTLDPHMANATIDGQMCLQISEPLVMRNQKSEIVPWLAESWEANENGTVWTFSSVRM